MTLPLSFFEADGEAWVATELTRGPWSNEHQHGGPVSALLARAAESFGDDSAHFWVARLTVDYFKPIPLARLEVDVQPLKLGKTAQRLTLRLSHRGEELIRATALRIRRKPGSAVSSRPPPFPSPDGLTAMEFPFFRHPVGYHRGVEGRYWAGTFGDNQVTVWMRPTAPLVPGETMTGLQRVVLVADAQSGVCNPLDVRRYTFVNPDLTVLLDRPPQGEWIALQSLSTASPLGIGLAQSAVYDAFGPVGRSAQSLVIEELPPQLASSPNRV